MSHISEVAQLKTFRFFTILLLASLPCSLVVGQRLDSSMFEIQQKSPKLLVPKNYTQIQKLDSPFSQVSAEGLKKALSKSDSSGGRTDTPRREIHREVTLVPAPARDSASPGTAAPVFLGPSTVIRSYSRVLDSLLQSAKWIHIAQQPVYFVSTRKLSKGKEFPFYSICLLVLFLGLFRTFYTAYFNKLIRVFFNTSIRQSQLTDQLGQATLPSFILNIFFCFSAGFYIWLLIRHYQTPKLVSSTLLLPFCVAGIGAIYLFKFFIIRAVGWMTGTRKATDQYIFVIFLVNKIAGIALIPFIILMEFAGQSWFHPLEIFSLLLLGLFFISRYLKTYSSLESRFPLNPLHFLIYILSIEIIPLLVIYKMAVDYFI